MPFPEIIRLDADGMPEGTWSLEDGPVVFGRDPGPGNVIRFSERMVTVSRQHARIERGFLGGWVLKDLGSDGGTSVNGIRVSRRRLRHDDTISIAGVAFKFRDSSRQGSGEVEVVRGPRKGERFSLDNGDVPVGRKVFSPHALCFPDEISVSAAHCRLRRKRRSYLLDDLGSKNGTLVNGRKVIGSTVLADGDHIVLGEVELKVHIRKG